MKKNNKFFSSLIIFVLAILLVSCANRFGVTHHMTLLRVNTPDNRLFYLLSVDKDKLYFGNTSQYVDVKKKDLIIDEEWHSGDNSLIKKSEGDYIFVIECGKFLKRTKVTITPDIINKFDIKCDGGFDE